MDIVKRILTLNIVSDINPTSKQKELLDLMLLRCKQMHNEALDILNKEYSVIDSSKQIDPMDFMLRVVKRSEPEPHLMDEIYLCELTTIFALSSDYSVYLDNLLDVVYQPNIKRPEYQDSKKAIHFCILPERCDVRGNMMHIKFLDDPIELLTFDEDRAPPIDKMKSIKIEVDAFGNYKAILSYVISEHQGLASLANHLFP